MKILKALITKEFYQILRDPSSILIAFVLPLMLLIIYMYGVNLDTVRLTMGLKVDDPSQQVTTLIDSFKNNKFVTPVVYNNPQKMYDDLTGSKLRGIVVIPNDFSSKLDRKDIAAIQVITDGSEVNLANYVQNYSKMIVAQWLYYTSKYSGEIPPDLINIDTRYWYNQDINSHYFILPGSLCITMTLIGMLLTALVVAREWERGTMEALLTTKVTKMQIVLGKYIPYFIVGMISMSFNVFMCINVFQIPFRGSLLILFIFSALFLFTAMGQGLLISTVLKNQFTASQAALVGGFLPALMLSGLVFPIISMPVPIQWLSKVVPSSYFVSCIQSEFMTGTVYEIIIPNCIFMGVLGIILFIVVYKKTQMRLE
ncbi:MAG: ABC transporter permease [Candidatus Gastranaerophilales bacterium]|nr:ABC transporter permease [Candidatus Gastranaerophilales bacterium]